jgi:hypothetical protein
MVDPLKVEAIVQLPPPCTVPQLQSLQCKEKFLWCFITNYVAAAESTIGMVLVQEDDMLEENM